MFYNETELAQWAQQAQRLWLFLDYDGTLADFAPTPAYVEADAKIINLIERLARKPTLRLTILSGRRLTDVQHLLPITGIFLAGTYGIEMVTPSGETIHRVRYEDIRPFLEAIKPQWEQLLNGRSGFFLEDKGWSLAIHARFADDAESKDIVMQAEKIAEAKIPQEIFCISHGHKFLEIAPLLANKRHTVEYLLTEYPFENARLLYFGDDDHDEEAFSVIHANHGVAVKVFQPSQISRSTNADFCFKSPMEVLHWLEQLV